MKPEGATAPHHWHAIIIESPDNYFQPNYKIRKTSYSQKSGDPTPHPALRQHTDRR